MATPIELAIARNISIPQMIREETVCLSADPVQAQRNREGLGKYFSSLKVQGVSNIGRAFNLARRGATVMIAGNHINKLDIQSRRMALESYALGEFIDLAAYPCELEWYENPVSIKWMGGDRLVRVATAFDIEQAKEAKALVEPGSEEEGIFNEYLANCDLLNACAFKELAKHNIRAVYPESRFQYDGRSTQAPRGVSHVFSPKSIDYVLPILTIGQEELPVNGNMDMAEPVPIRVIAGEVYPSGNLWRRDRPREITPVDMVMGSIVRLDPTFESDSPRYIREDYVEFYKQIIAEAGHLFRYSEAA